MNVSMLCAGVHGDTLAGGTTQKEHVASAFTSAFQAFRHNTNTRARADCN